MRSGSRPVGYKGFRQGPGGHTANAALAAKYRAPMMTRGGFLRGAGVAGAGVAGAMIGMGGVARAQTPPVTDVYPTGDPAQDVPNVQAAVAAGGTVLLKATSDGTTPMYFNFGNDGRVNLSQDVTIMGEAGNIVYPDDGMTANKTMIVGGGGSGLSAGSITCNTPIEFTVKDIHFHKSHYCSIFANYSRAGGTIEITGCKGTDYIGEQPNPGWPPFIMGLFAGDNLPTWAGGPGGALKGTVNIHHNELDFYGGIDSGGVYHASAISVNDVPDLEELICSDNFAVLDGALFLFCPSVRNILAENNIVQPPAEDKFVAGGIHITRHFSWFPIYPENVTIRNNWIYNAYRLGITVGYVGYASAGSALIENNHILNGPCTWEFAINIFRSRNCVVVNNEITGDLAFCGLLIDDYGHNKTYDNVFSGNDLSGSTAAVAQVYLDSTSHDNEFKNNDYGPVVLDPPGIAGVWIQGHNNTLTNENFNGNYPGFDVGGPGCVLLDLGSGNKITALKNGQALQGFALCHQILDLSDPNPFDYV